jgi:menaquinol-cytochrome c reductase cytochrome b/c subunit
MATAVVARPAARPQPRSREEEVLVWPDLVFVEFISALVFTVAIFVLSAAVNAPLLDEANAQVTPNPSKAPWYLLNLQELLLHMDPAMAGVIIPTIWLVILGAFPYFDRSNEGQGLWFATENSVKLTIVAAAVGVVGTWALILWNGGIVAQVMDDWFGLRGGDTFRFLENSRAIQTQLPWPGWAESIPYLPFELKVFGGTGAAGRTEGFQNLNFPAWLVEQGIPMAFLVGLPSIMLWVMWRIGWINNRRDALIALFSGFVGAYGVLTMVGTGFRGQGQELEWPWQLHSLEGFPGEEAGH